MVINPGPGPVPPPPTPEPEPPSIPPPEPTPPPTPTPEPTPIPIPVPTLFPKKGVGLTPGNPLSWAQNVGAKWYYDWRLHTASIVASDRYVAIIRPGVNLATVSTLAMRNRGRYWLVFNEPDLSSQGNLPVAQAALYYPKVEAAIYGADPSAKIIVGNVRDPKSNGGLGWIRGFRAAYFAKWKKWPRHDGIGVHWYAETQTYTPAFWQKALTDFWKSLRSDNVTGEIWLTEWGCLQNDTLGLRVMIEQTPWLEAQPWLNRYAWFATRTVAPQYGSLCMPFTGKLTRLGETYKALP